MILDNMSTEAQSLSALIVAITGLITAVFAGVHSLRTNKKTNSNAQKIDELEKQNGSVPK